MYVRCTHCGYDNSPEYRFCGMCGGSLAHRVTETRPPLRDVAPPPVAPPVPTAPPSPVRAVSPGPAPVPAPPTQQYRAESARPAASDAETVHGPSFLGLSEDPKVEFSYLYEEEPARSHAGLVAILLLLIAAGGFLGWQWRHNGFPFNRLSAGGSSGQTASSPPAAAAPDASQPSDAQTATSSKPPEVPAQQGENTGASPPQPSDALTKKAGADEAVPRTSVPAKSRATKLESAHARGKPAAIETAALATSPDSDLELAGERYLYGSGLPQNCVRAESSLRTAATHGNPKAETVLGTMYATGHCVGRDVPTAYRWFARALHQDPQNSRISADLQVLWRQMTPEEKQLATASKQ